MVAPAQAAPAAANIETCACLVGLCRSCRRRAQQVSVRAAGEKALRMSLHTLPGVSCSPRVRSVIMASKHFLLVLFFGVCSSVFAQTTVHFNFRISICAIRDRSAKSASLSSGSCTTSFGRKLARTACPSDTVCILFRVRVRLRLRRERSVGAGTASAVALVRPWLESRQREAS